MNYHRITCRLFGHKYFIARRMNPDTRKLGCKRCGNYWAMHDPTRSLLPWDSDFEAMYAPGGPLDPATDPRNHGLPAYPEGNVIGACVCGSWPGGECLQCRVVNTNQPTNERKKEQP